MRGLWLSRSRIEPLVGGLRRCARRVGGRGFRSALLGLRGPRRLRRRLALLLRPLRRACGWRPLLDLLARAGWLLTATRRHLLGMSWLRWRSRLSWLRCAGLLLSALGGLFLVRLTTLVGWVRGFGLSELSHPIKLLRHGGTTAPWPDHKGHRAREGNLPL